MSDSSLDPLEFRNALGTFTTGVTIITARGPDGTPVGVTANSFNSVSLDPPLVLWSLAKNAGSLPVFEAAKYFAVHILAADQEELSNRFASRGSDKFGNLEVETGLGGTPLLSGCCTRMQCRTAYQYEGGDHVILVGEVVNFDRSEAAPLVFQAGKYALASRKTDETPLLSTQSGENASFSEDFLGYLLWRAYFQFHKVARRQPAIARHDDLEFLILVSLFHGGDRRLEDLAAAMSYDSGEDAITRAIAALSDSGLVRLTGRDGQQSCTLTAQGQEETLLILAAAKSTEADFLEKLGLWESVALKNLLKQFIVETDPGLPHLWEARTGTED
jgi:3-hydroxy-9,10-secoandrosta-1,3,5(10)-triene-9,17-dione monooxygenase reductase component